MHVKTEVGDGLVVQVGNCPDRPCAGVHREELPGCGLHNLIHKQSVPVAVSIGGSNHQWAVIQAPDNAVDRGCLAEAA